MLHLADYGSSDEESAEGPNERSKGQTPAVSTFLSALPKPAENVASKQKRVYEDENPLDDIVKKHKWEEKAEPNSVNRKVKGKVKISLPTIPDVGSSDEDDRDNSPAPRKTSGPSALLSMLPAPKIKNSNSNKLAFVPKSAQTGIHSQKNPVDVLPKPTTTSLIPSTVLAAKTKQQSSSVLSTDYASEESADSGNEGDDDDSNDYFRLEKSELETPENQFTADRRYPEIVTNYEDNAVVNQSSVHSSQMYNLANVSPSDAAGPSSSSTASGYSDGGAHLDMNEARRIIYENEIKPFCGEDFSADLPEDLSIVDVSVDSQLGNVRENLLKNITGITKRPVDPALEAARLALAAGGKKKSKDKPSQQAKRKHQITYLAHLAKEREETLKDQWAQNKYNKRQTQMKYGF